LEHTSDPTGQFYDCPEPGGAANPACLQYTGAFIFESLGYPSNWTWRPIVVLPGFVFLFLILSGVVLHYFKVEMNISRARTTDLDTSVGKEQLTSHSLQDVRTVPIALADYSLDIQKHKVWGGKAAKISILKPISALFEPGVLNVIMGPSGSGKTSLLSSMAYRLHSNFSTRYQTNGTMTYAGSIPSEDVVRSVASYVCQDDDALLPTLTVRETLHFAAGLRLPTWMSKEEKKRRAESVLLKLGLKDCADNLIGNDLVKGISGGEKRRVTIAVQILTDPRILLLDEPTSGLDAFTASSIIEVLRGLAEEGRTLVLTIHQSRSDLWNAFGNVLLLARGGFPVYAGSGNAMLSHFSRLGYECPQTTNPADFALDLITVDLQHAVKEAKSREKVRSLISDWDTARRSQLITTASHISAPAELGSLKRSMTPFRVSFPLLVQRSIIGFKRDPNAILARTTQVFAFAVVVTLFFAPLKSDYESIQSRLGYIQEFAGKSEWSWVLEIGS
jgi:ABC-type multidrug transport system ATPase subunit